MKNAETSEREINALLKMAKRVDVSDILILTKDEEETIITNDFAIKVMPVWKWLLEKKD